MEITSDCVVALTWTLKDTLGEVLDELDEPVEFLMGGNDLLPKIEHALMGHGVGAKLDLHLEPEDAFGDFQEELLFLEPKDLFPAEIQEGMTIEGSALPAACNPPSKSCKRALAARGFLKLKWALMRATPCPQALICTDAADFTSSP